MEADDARLEASSHLEQSCGLETGVELENDDRGGIHRRRQSIQCEEAELGNLFRVDRYLSRPRANCEAHGEGMGAVAIRVFNDVDGRVRETCKRDQVAHAHLEAGLLAQFRNRSSGEGTANLATTRRNLPESQVGAPLQVDEPMLVHQEHLSSGRQEQLAAHELPERPQVGSDVSHVIPSRSGADAKPRVGVSSASAKGYRVAARTSLSHVENDLGGGDQRPDASAVDGLGEAVRLAFGDDDVGVMKQPVVLPPSCFADSRGPQPLRG